MSEGIESMTTTHDLAETLATVTEALANTLLHHGHHLLLYSQ